MAPIASRVAELNGEGALSVFARAKELEKLGRSIIHLELGEPDFHPAAPVVDALRSAVAAGRDRYVSPRGIPALREAVAEYLLRTRSVHAAPEQVLIAPGCKMALSLAMMALIEPGDEVLYPDPGFPIYPSFARGLGAKAVPFFLEEKNQFQPDLREIAAKISPRTKVLIFNSPNNPTGTVFSDAALAQIAELAAKHDLWIIADEIYARILFSGAYKSIWSLPGMAERTVIIDGFSKSFAMTGWRLGYAVGDAKWLEKIGLLNDLLYICAPTPLQHALVAAFDLPASYYDQLRSDYARKLEMICDASAEAGIRPLRPQGSYYLLADISELGVADDQEAARVLLSRVGVAAVPGSSFYADPADGRLQVRLCFAKEASVLEEACRRIRTLRR